MTILWLVLALSGCAPPPEDGSPRPRLVLLYATCTLNRDYLAPYDPEVGSTPHLARFGREAVVFERHMTESGQSGTAYASIFSGTQADRHGVFRHPTPLADAVELIGEAFRRAGWDVAAWLEHDMASGELGYAQGADPERSFFAKLTAEDPAFRAVLARLRREPAYRALLVTNFTVTHGPYQRAPLEEFCGRYPGECQARADREDFDRYVDFYRRSHAFLSYDFPATRERAAMSDGHLEHLAAAVELLYRAGVGYLDHLFGGVVDEIRAAGLLEQSVIAFTADHGETLFREGTYFKWTHGHQLAPEVLAVPLLVRAPGVPPGRFEGVTRSIDVFPTLAGLAGVASPPPAAGGGVDLSAALRGREPPPELTAYSHTALVAEAVAESSRKWGLFHALHPRIDPELMWVQLRERDRVYQLRRSPAGEPEPMVFDLASDPRTLENLFDASDPGQRRAFRDLRRYRERLVRGFRGRAGEELDRARQEELLRALGYID